MLGQILCVQAPVLIENGIISLKDTVTVLMSLEDRISKKSGDPEDKTDEDGFRSFLTKEENVEDNRHK